MSDGWACFSRNGKYRYLLGRKVSDAPGRLLFIMLNPSTATETKPDRTITRCINFARDWGYGTMEVVNLFAFKTAYPVVLQKAARPVGTHNNAYIRDAVNRADRVVLAWSGEVAKNSEFKRRAGRVLNMVCEVTLPYHLDFTKTGEPRHPRVLRRDVIPRMWTRPQIAEYIRSHS